MVGILSECEGTNMTDDDEDEGVEKAELDRSSPMTCPSANQYIRSLPPIQPSTTMARDTCSRSISRDVCVG